jgi:hypothetical protein
MRDKLTVVGDRFAATAAARRGVMMRPGFDFGETKADRVVPLATRRFFLVAVAIIAAAIADPIVESLANAGIFGGHYADNNHLSVLPALFVGGVLVLLTLALRCFGFWRDSHDPDDWVIRVARSFSGRSPARDMPCVFLMQLLALFVMENAEQVCSGGKLLGGTAWLGGPIFFSLLAHALIGAACLFALAMFMRGLLRTLASFVRAIVRFVWLTIARSSSCTHFGHRATSLSLAQAPHVRQIGGRAPPLLLQTPA